MGYVLLARMLHRKRCKWQGETVTERRVERNLTSRTNIDFVFFSLNALMRPPLATTVLNLKVRRSMSGNSQDSSSCWLPYQSHQKREQEHRMWLGFLPLLKSEVCNAVAEVASDQGSSISPTTHVWAGTDTHMQGCTSLYSYLQISTCLFRFIYECLNQFVCTYTALGTFLTCTFCLSTLLEKTALEICETR